MSHEFSLQTATPFEATLYPSSETLAILSQNPDDLLNSIFESDPNNPFLLRGSGFSMSKQIQTWSDGLKEAIINNDNLEEFRHKFIRRTMSDVVGFYFEYLSRQDIFPINVEISENSNGDPIVWAEEYQKELQDLAIAEEREGALKEGVKKAVDIIIKSGPETIVMLISPQGRSGLIEQGREIIFPDNQAYVYWIDEEGNLEGATIRTDINLDSSERALEIEDGNENEWERTKTVVRSPKTFSANSLEAALDLIESAAGRTFPKQREEIKRRKELFNLNGEAKAIIEGLRIFLTENIIDLNRDTVEIFVNSVGKAILDLGNLTLNINGDIILNTESQNFFYDKPPTNYNQIAAIVATIPGCNGGSLKNIDVNEALTRYMQKNSSAGELFNTCSECGARLECGYCQACKKLKVVIAA